MPVALLAAGNAVGQLAAIIGTPMHGQGGLLVACAEGWQFVIITLIGPSAGKTILIHTNKAKTPLPVLGIPDAFSSLWVTRSIDRFDA